MEITVVKGDVYTVASKTACTVTTINGTPLGTAEAGSPYTFTATSDRLILSDDEAEFTRVNPKYAPIKMRLLGLLGGGVTPLPQGYLAAKFLESTGTQSLYTDIAPFSSTEKCSVGMYVDAQILDESGNRCIGGAMQAGAAYFTPYQTWAQNVVHVRFGAFDKSISNPYMQSRFIGSINFKEDNRYEIKNEHVEAKGELTWSLTSAYNSKISFFAISGNNKCSARIWVAKITVGQKLSADFIPSIDARGVPCMFDRVSKQPFYKSGTEEFIVGMTLAQARKLGKLPAGGGTLTVSLPSNWQEDEGVMNARAEAETKGWQITVRTYEATAGASATFALRRIWVRKQQDEYGSYVAADGSRWSIDWCVDIWGADPQELGYEPYRSVDAAVSYWELEPYVNPEEDLTEPTTNEYE